MRRQGEQLNVVKGKAYQPSAKDLAWLEQKAKKDKANGLVCDRTSDTKVIASCPPNTPAISTTQEEATTVVVQQQQILRIAKIASDPEVLNLDIKLHTKLDKGFRE